jgi:hypothetical protein
VLVVELELEKDNHGACGYRVIPPSFMVKMIEFEDEFEFEDEDELVAATPRCALCGQILFCLWFLLCSGCAFANIGNNVVPQKGPTAGTVHPMP